MQSPLTRRLAAGIAGIALTLGAYTLPAAATVHQDDLPSYTCDTAQWFNTRSARGEGDCIPSNGAPSTGYVEGRFSIHTRDVPPVRIVCGGGGTAFSIPESVTGFGCGRLSDSLDTPDSVSETGNNA